MNSISDKCSYCLRMHKSKIYCEGYTMDCYEEEPSDRKLCTWKFSAWHCCEALKKDVTGKVDEVFRAFNLNPELSEIVGEYLHTHSLHAIPRRLSKSYPMTNEQWFEAIKKWEVIER